MTESAESYLQKKRGHTFYDGAFSGKWAEWKKGDLVKLDVALIAVKKSRLETAKKILDFVKGQSDLDLVERWIERNFLQAQHFR